MTTATYRGVQYDTDVKREQLVSNWLPVIQKQLEKQKKINEAQYHMATLR